MNKQQDKRTAIIAHVAKHGRITKKEAVEIAGSGYYYNAEKYVGEILSRLVNAGVLKREKPGVFVPGERSATSKRGLVNPNLPKLF